ncbi:ent-kaur-16-ene synthase [Hirsutella rhossiliensis]|uniref:Ent-kaur-16-ene synthase n=1 Tax=Hirsutella rhossiliensis TaxID=111463 RepID=A0A9P8MQJ9_9HYPO|nr:ent-kaur-16-ene synthase [Hirsutella rhossiliensis]KAH0960448.1 ent-kaur-16-ene synthase [Hirsutella rhossiliensis]
MMASPSSTAAYLINASRWNEEAEAYLRHVVKAGTGHGDGGIPGTFPTTYFEYSWILATLLRSGFSKLDLECAELQGISDILGRAFQEEQGIIGFAPRAADVDDTAKCLLALGMLDRHVNPDRMIRVFEVRDHFATFGSERDPSFTSNCHVLLALLHHPDNSRYYPQILKTTRFICGRRWNGDHHIKDKWHLSHLYPTMLLAEAFTDLLRLLDSGGAFLDMAGPELHLRVSISLFQACLRTMLEQREDGSWNGLPEQTCYAILALAEARHVCFFNPIQAQLQSAIDRGIDSLKSNNFRSTDYNWTSKTAYQVAFVAEAYTLASLKVRHPTEVPGSVGYSLGVGFSAAEMDSYVHLVRQTSLFSAVPEWQIRASLLESSLFIPLLRAQRLEVYARDETRVTEDKYLNIIPFTWVGCNNRCRIFASASFLYDLMLLSLLGYQTDEFIETIAAPAFPETTNLLHELIDKIIDSTTKDDTDCVDDSNGLKSINAEDGDNCSRHEAVLRSSLWDRNNLCEELRAFLHAHATQIGDNSQFEHQVPQSTDVYTSTTRPFFQWRDRGYGYGDDGYRGYGYGHYKRDVADVEKRDIEKRGTQGGYDDYGYGYGYDRDYYYGRRYRHHRHHHHRGYYDGWY